MPNWLVAVITLLFGTASLGALFAAVLKWVLENPDKANLIAEKVYTKARWMSGRADRNAVASGIQGQIGAFAKKANKLAGDVMPYALKVEWVEKATLESFLENDEIIVRMDYHTNQARNLALAATHFVKHGVIPRAKGYVGHSLRTAIDLLVTQKLLGEADARALDYFLANIFDPELEKDRNIQSMVSKLVALDGRGLFTSILLRQLADLARRIYPAMATDEIREEIVRFVDYLVRIAQREKFERLGDNLGFIGTNIRCAVILVAASDTMYGLGESAYLRRAATWFGRGAEVLFFLAWEPHLESCRAMCAGLRNNAGVDFVLENRFTVKYEGRDQEYSCTMVTTKVKSNVSHITPDCVVDLEAEGETELGALGMPVPAGGGKQAG